MTREFDVSDLRVEVADLLNNRTEREIGLAFFVAALSALKKAPPVMAMLDNGAKRALIPIEKKLHFLEVTAD